MVKSEIDNVHKCLEKNPSMRAGIIVEGKKKMRGY